MVKHSHSADHSGAAHGICAAEAIDGGVGAGPDAGGFLAPDHDHAACAGAIVERAEARCHASGARLTAQRRAVLEALAGSHRPIGAYEIIQALAASGPAPAPISVYRALNFLTEQGLVHRIERLNAFVACAGTHGQGNPLVFLICERCGQVGEMPAANAGIDFGRLSAETGFVPHSAALELSGLCRHCAAATLEGDGAGRHDHAAESHPQS